MKIVTSILLSALLISPALAQQPSQGKPDLDAFQAQYLMETGSLRTELGKALQSASSAQKQVADLQKQLADEKAKHAPVSTAPVDMPKDAPKP
jgi:hypothetical protein